MNPFHGRHFQGEIILYAVRWYWHNPTDLSSWHIDETYVKVNGRWSYLYRAAEQHGYTIDFYLSSRRSAKSAYCFLGKILNNMKQWQIPRVIKTDKAPTYGGALLRLKQEGKCSPNLEHRQVGSVIESINSDSDSLSLRQNVKHVVPIDVL